LRYGDNIHIEAVLPAVDGETDAMMAMELNRYGVSSWVREIGSARTALGIAK
jgi:hypothetical protein